MQLHALSVVRVLFGNLPGLASELVRGGVLQELLCLVRHPLSECRNDACDDNMAEENCDSITAENHTTDMVELAMLMFAVLREMQLPQVRPRLALAAVQLCMRCPITLLNQGGCLSMVNMHARNGYGASVSPNLGRFQASALVVELF